MSVEVKDVAREVARHLRVQPRVVFLSDAPRYLGMGRTQFHCEVRPHVNEAKMGARVVFDREELDEWWADYLATHGRRGKKPTAEELRRWQGSAAVVEALDSRKSRTASGTSIGSTKSGEYAKARAQAASKMQKST